MLTLNDGRKEMYQWDTGRIATTGVECNVVHFSNLKYGASLAVEVKNGEVAIPNKLLMSGEPIYCWAFVSDENGNYTKQEQTLNVNKRPKPADYVYTETEVLTWEALDTRIKVLEENSGSSGIITETDPTVFAWAKSHLPFTADQLSAMANGAGFVVNPTNFADGKTYFRYHAGATSFTWTNPNQQVGAVTITVLAWAQWGDKNTANAFSALNIVYGDGTTGRLSLVNGQTVTMTTDAGKVLAEIRGNYDHENWVLLDMSVLTIAADYPAPTGTVKSVNGIEPDETGNVEIPTGGDGTDANAVHYTADTPTEEQQMQARANLDLYREDIEVTEEKEVTVELDSSNSEGTITGEIDMNASKHGGVWCDGDIIRVILGDYTFDGTVTLTKVDPWTYGCKVMASMPADNHYRTLEYNPFEMVWYVSGGGYELDLEETEIMRVYRIVRHVVPDDYIPDTIARKTELPGKMSGATSDADGTSGLVPAPAAGDEGKVLFGNGTWGDLPESGGGTDLSLGVSGAAVGQTVRITAVDDSGKPTAWEAVDWKVIATGDITEDVTSLEFTGIEKYNEFLMIADFAGGNISGVTLKINGKQVSIRLGAYFVHNHRKFNVTMLKIDRERKYYELRSVSQEMNSIYNQDNVADILGQTLNGDNEIENFSFVLDSEKYVKAGSSYVMYAR